MAFDKEAKKIRGIYLVPDPLMMKPQFGPSEHIKAGMEQLSKYFDMQLLVIGTFEQSHSPSVTKASRFSGKATGNGAIGAIRDIRLFLKSNRCLDQLVERIAQSRAEFIYERGQYLDLRGLRAAKKLGIPHFYEVNWLNFLGIRQFYHSWLNLFAQYVEEWSYRSSDLNFIIGSQHKLIKIPSDKVCTIQNGIDVSVLRNNENQQNNVSEKIRICYVANLMPHHRFDILLQAIEKCPVANRLEFHFVGYNFEQYRHRISKETHSFFHGPKNKEELASILRSCNIGLVSGGPSYSSFMKLFEYAAFKLCVISPDLDNVKTMFSDEEIMYFKTDSSSSLADLLTNVVEQSRVIPEFGERIFQKVKENYTWEAIYHKVADKIKDAV